MIKTNIPLESLYLENPFIVLLIRGLKFSPPMHVHGVSKLILKSLDLGPLIEQFLFLEANLGFELINTPDFGINRHILIPESGQT